MTGGMPRQVDEARLVADLARLDVHGRSVLVHCSLRRVGPVLGGAATVFAALRGALGDGSTVVVPAQTPNNSTTSDVYRDATKGLSPEEMAAVEERMPGFDRSATPSFGMGALAEYVRNRPGAVRSAHPQASFAAQGPGAQVWMAVHDLDCHLGERSPLAALYDAGVWILLLGVDYKACTALHLAEYRLPWPAPRQGYRCYLATGGRREQRDFEAAAHDTSDFPAIGAELDNQPFVRTGVFGNGNARALPLRDAVDFAVVWMSEHRRRSGHQIGLPDQRRLAFGGADENGDAG